MQSIEIDFKGNQKSMTKKGVKVKRTVKTAVAKAVHKAATKHLRNKKRASGVKLPKMGPVTTIDTAPVAIGNSYQGVSPVVVPIIDGVRVRGRDYLLSIDSTAASITGWTLVAGAPLTPACMVASVIKQFSLTYAQYVINAMTFHYITTASTSETGSVMFCINKDRQGPGLITSSSNFLPTVLSDHNTLIAPLWKNSSAQYVPAPEWESTSVGMYEDMKHQALGELFVFTKTAVTDSPGFVLVDYDISFRQMQYNTRSLTLPISRMKYTQVVITIAPGTVNTIMTMSIASGTLMDGVTASAAPTGATYGDIYKVICNFSNASGGAGGNNNTWFAMQGFASNYNPINTVDGFTCYAAYQNSAQLRMAGTPTASIDDADFFVYGTTTTTILSIPAYISYVGSQGGLALQSNY